ncbi:MAG: SurA N-terminal domain-containing protein [Deltaproteobacteria bacterium]|nr:MAG: SurA N-terminal domain-containing protein [Deltaproteobacteria bacterium]
MFITAMRKHTKGILIKIIVGLIAVVFTFWGIYTIRGAKPGAKIAYVNGDLISGVEFEALYRDMLRSFQQQYKEYWNENLLKALNIEQRALESLINKRLISQEAARLGLGITDEEIADAIYNYPAFQINGQFDEGRYRFLLSQNRMQPADFEAGIKLDLLGQKINQTITSFLPITEAEVLSYYTYQNEQIALGFVSFNPDDFKGSGEVTDVKRDEYFQENKEKYRIPAKIKIASLTIDPSGYLDKVTVAEDEISEFYELNPEAFKEPEQVKARHILFKVPPGASESEDTKAKEEALAILEKAKGGEDFATLAKEHSQGPTASKGGDLGYFSRGQMVKPFEELAFSLNKGEIGGPVKTQFGWHLIKVEDKKPAIVKTLPEVRDQIEASIKQDMAREMANERMLTLMDQMPYDLDLATYAAQHGLTVKETDFFPKDGPIPGFGSNEQLLRSINVLEKSEVSDIIEHEDKFHLIQIVDTQDSYIPEISEVSDQLDSDLKKHLSLVAAKEEAKRYLEELKGGAGWPEQARKKGLKTDETGLFRRGGSIPSIGYAPFLSEAAFSLSDQKRYPDDVFEVDNKVYVIRWLNKKGIDMTDYEKEKDDFKQMLLATKERRVFDAWLKSLKDRAEIKIVTPIG